MYWKRPEWEYIIILSVLDTHTQKLKSEDMTLFFLDIIAEEGPVKQKMCNCYKDSRVTLSQDMSDWLTLTDPTQRNARFVSCFVERPLI